MRVRNDKAILTIVQARPEMRGEYTCRAVNDQGESYTKANLEVIGKLFNNSFFFHIPINKHYLIQRYCVICTFTYTYKHLAC